MYGELKDFMYYKLSEIENNCRYYSKIIKLNNKYFSNPDYSKIKQDEIITWTDGNNDDIRIIMELGGLDEFKSLCTIMIMSEETEGFFTVYPHKDKYHLQISNLSDNEKYNNYANDLMKLVEDF